MRFVRRYFLLVQGGRANNTFVFLALSDIRWTKFGMIRTPVFFARIRRSYQISSEATRRWTKFGVIHAPVFSACARRARESRQIVLWVYRTCEQQEEGKKLV